jgi:hypothetical protein
VKGWEKIFQAKEPSKQSRIAILISDKVGFKPKLIRKDKEGHFILTKRTTNQDNQIMIFSIYAPNVCAYNFIKQTLLDLKVPIYPNTMIM